MFYLEFSAHIRVKKTYVIFLFLSVVFNLTGPELFSANKKKTHTDLQKSSLCNQTSQNDNCKENCWTN